MLGNLLNPMSYKRLGLKMHAGSVRGQGSASSRPGAILGLHAGG